jgi:hypothetical protein
MVCAFIFFGIPLADRFSPALRNLIRRINMPVFPLWTAPLAIVSFAFMIVPRMVGKNVHNFDEMGELYAAMAYFAFALSAYAKARPVLESARAEEASRAAVRAEDLALDAVH